jgi:xylulokinase
LTIDLGTTFYKLTLFDRSGNVLHSSRVSPAVKSTEDGRMELSADDCIAAISAGILELRKQNDGQLSDVEAVTFATQTNSFALFDAPRRPMTPFILWPDRRAADLETELRGRWDTPGFAAASGIPSLTHQFMAAKLLWLQRNEPEIWKNAAEIRLLSDFVTHFFTGKFVTEAGTAGLTGFVDIHRLQWRTEMLDRFGLRTRMLPAIVRAGADLGQIDGAIAARFGLPATCRFIVGCLDQYAGAIGGGNIEPGMISETTGTALATVRCADRFDENLGPHVFQGPAFREGVYWRMAFGDVSANYLQWYRDHLPDSPDSPDFDRLSALAERIEPGADGLRLRPGAAMTADPKSVFNGLAPRHTPGHAVRCIMEAVAFELSKQIAALSGDSTARKVLCAGGGARSDLWLQIKADVLGAATVASICPEPTSLGAAMLAESTLAKTPLKEIASRWVRLKTPHFPDMSRHAQYRTLFGNR